VSHRDYSGNTGESFKYLFCHILYCEKKMKSSELEQIKKIVKRKSEEAREECLKLANPLQLSYEQLSSSERTLVDFCYYLDNYDPSVLEKLRDIINMLFYG